MKNSIKVLDCTLRDGGYVIDWMFGKKNIESIIQNLIDAKIDFVECGFLKDFESNFDKTFFQSINELNIFESNFDKLCLMINFGEYSIDNFVEYKSKKIKIRVAFKKHNQDAALNYIKELINLGWEVFVNPMSTNTYTKEELKNLIEKINTIKPYGITIVDTLGNMYEQQVINIFELIDEILDKDISICFHSHNSMQLSFSNTKALLKMGVDRNIIIDSCLYGMGRGAGNLCTELITKYLNDNYSNNYDIFKILKTIEDNIKPFYNKKQWGYSTPYYIAAITGCHPNYATYLVENKFTDEKINQLLNSIPSEYKTIYNSEIIKQLAKI